MADSRAQLSVKRFFVRSHDTISGEGRSVCYNGYFSKESRAFISRMDIYDKI
jgi:hypothetical protein